MPFAGGNAQFFAEAAGDIAMRDIGGRPVISGGQYPSILDNNGSHLTPQARRALRDELGNRNEIDIPGGSLELFCFYLQR